jgi:hypothetical protein
MSTVKNKNLKLPNTKSKSQKAAKKAKQATKVTPVKQTETKEIEAERIKIEELRKEREALEKEIKELRKIKKKEEKRRQKDAKKSSKRVSAARTEIQKMEKKAASYAKRYGVEDLVAGSRTLKQAQDRYEKMKGQVWARRILKKKEEKDERKRITAALKTWNAEDKKEGVKSKKKGPVYVTFDKKDLNFSSDYYNAILDEIEDKISYWEGAGNSPYAIAVINAFSTLSQVITSVGADDFNNRCEQTVGGQMIYTRIMNLMNSLDEYYTPGYDVGFDNVLGEIIALLDPLTDDWTEATDTVNAITQTQDWAATSAIEFEDYIEV